MHEPNAACPSLERKSVQFFHSTAYRITERSPLSIKTQVDYQIKVEEINT
ncbi:MAG: hypothetical protein ACI86M_002201 [Saprospiraceae bacterium]|jgi:hypothetical protein